MEQQPQQNPSGATVIGDAEAQLGGADSIEKTTCVFGSGTEPEARSEGAIATVPSGRAPRMVTVVVAVLVILVALAYLIGIMR